MVLTLLCMTIGIIVVSWIAWEDTYETGFTVLAGVGGAFLGFLVSLFISLIVVTTGQVEYTTTETYDPIEITDNIYWVAGSGGEFNRVTVFYKTEDNTIQSTEISAKSIVFDKSVDKATLTIAKGYLEDKVSHILLEPLDGYTDYELRIPIKESVK